MTGKARPKGWIVFAFLLFGSVAITTSVCGSQSVPVLAGKQVKFALNSSIAAFLPPGHGYPPTPTAISADLAVTGCGGAVSVAVDWDGKAVPTAAGLTMSGYAVQTQVLVPPNCTGSITMQVPVPTGPGEHQACATFTRLGDSLRSCGTYSWIPLCDKSIPITTLCFIGGMGPEPTDPVEQEHLLLQGQWNHLMSATLAFNSPETISLGETGFVTAYVALPTTEIPTPEGSGPASEVTTRVSNKVTITMTDDKEPADVTQVEGSSTQTVIDGTATKWEWKIVPSAAGIHKLRLQQFDELTAQGLDVSQLYQAKEVDVYVPPNSTWEFQQQLLAISLLQWLELFFGGGIVFTVATLIGSRIVAHGKEVAKIDRAARSPRKRNSDRRRPSVRR